MSDNEHTKMGQWQLPALVGCKAENEVPVLIRAVTNEEMVRLHEISKRVSNLRTRFSLFAIVNRNYVEWANYVTSLLRPVGAFVESELVELDRHLTNFLSSAYALLCHFDNEWTRQFRRTPKRAEFKDFISRAETKSWAFRFFQDLRNCAQHCHLPIGQSSRTSNMHSVSIKINADAKWLTEHYKDWANSGLSAEKGSFDLLVLAHEYHGMLMRDFGKFLATNLAPNIIDDQQYLQSLANEVRRTNPLLETRLLQSCTAISNNQFNLTYEIIPSDIFAEIGIILERR